MKKQIILFVLLFISFLATAQKSFLQSGPMVGYSEMMEVMLWIQTNTPAEVQFKYWEKEKPTVSFLTVPVKTTKKEAFTAHCIADEVYPGKRYEYTVLINGQEVELDYSTTFQSQTLWQYRTDPPNFVMAIGSCTYVNESEFDRPGRPYGGEYQIFKSIHKKHPDAMLWMGDNTYMREVDWYTRTGVMHRYTHTRSLPEMQPLLASTHNYATWDDHDFGPNDSDRTITHKDFSMEAFKAFWGNNGYGIDGKGITSKFQFNDIDFFLLDNRTFRTANHLKKGKKTMLGQQQLEWIIEALAASRSPFKMVVIGGQVLNTVAKYENYANHHAEERAYLLQRIEEEDIKGVIFLTGDRHHTELSKYENKAGNMVYDLTVSPLTAGPANMEYVKDEANKYRVKETIIAQRNFGLLEFNGSRKERHLKIRIFDVEGEELWNYDIDAVKQ